MAFETRGIRNCIRCFFVLIDGRLTFACTTDRATAVFLTEACAGPHFTEFSYAVAGTRPAGEAWR